MDRQVSSPAEGSAYGSVRAKWAATLILLGLLAWQAWMTLTLFGTEQPWRRLLDDQPIVSGQHPLHLYHGYLGARAFRERGSLCCFDPSFQAGYPKTPLFDSGSRPAELFLALAGKTFAPSAYKTGLAICCLLVPLLLAVAARGVGLGPGGTVLATGAGLLIWWGAPCRQLLEAGELDLLLGSLLAVTHVGILVGYDRSPGFLAWSGLLLTASLGWFAHPPIFLSLLPLHLVYYLSVGVKHRLAWHVGLVGSLAAGIAVNAFWLPDWLNYWWICSPLPAPVLPLEHRTLYTIWSAELWGGSADRALAVAVTLVGLIGVVILNQTKQRAAARLLALGAGGSLVLAVAGIAWEPLGRVGTSKLLAPALWYAVLPAAHALVEAFRQLGVALGSPRRGLVASCGFLAVGGLGLRPHVDTFVARSRGAEPLAVGLGPHRQNLIETLIATTTPEARILWEDRSSPTGRSAALDPPSRWTALLPILTERAFIGGLDPDSRLDHAYASGIDQTWQGGRSATGPTPSWNSSAGGTTSAG